jgi:probable phosphoglycerate mutase
LSAETGHPNHSTGVRLPDDFAIPSTPLQYVESRRSGPTAAHNDEVTQVEVDQPRLWLVRHGETEWSRSGQHTSRTDIPLTDLGRAQATGVAHKLVGHDFALVLSSPKVRALETARLAGFGDRVETTEDLLEWDYGADEGRTTADIRADRPGWTIWSDGPLGGETAAEVAARIDRVIARVRRADGDTLAFAHGHVLRVLAARWIGEPPSSGRSFELGTATVSVLGWERETPTIERWNEACG